MKYGYVETHGIRLHYAEAGNGPLMLCVHGFPSAWHCFKRQMTAFSETYRVVSIDGLGANLSSKPDDLSLYKLPVLAEQVDAVARQLSGDDPFVLMGHDWGGALAWAFAQRYPSRLTKLIVMSAPPANQLISMLMQSPEQQERSRYMYSMRSGKHHQTITENNGHALWQMAYGVLHERGVISDEELEAFRVSLSQPGAVDGGINWYRANVPPLDEMTEADCWPSIDASTTVPSLLFWGQEDGTFNPEFVDELDQFVDDLSVVRLEGVRHWPMLERTAEVNQAIARFLSN